MAKGLYSVVDGVTRKVKKLYTVVDGVTRKVKKVYSVVDGVTRLTWQNAVIYLFSGSSAGTVTVSNEDDNHATITTLLESTGGIRKILNVNDNVVILRTSYTIINKYDSSSNLLTTIGYLTPTGSGNHYGYNMIYGGGYYVAVGYKSDNGYWWFYGTSLSSWTAVFGYSGTGQSMIFLGYYDGYWYYVYQYAYSSTYNAYVYRLPNPTTTTGREQSAVISQDIGGFCIFNGYIICTTSTNDYLYYCLASSDMSSWSSIYLGYQLINLTVCGDVLLAIDRSTYYLYKSTDGITWTAVTTPTIVRAISYYEGVYYYIYGSAVYASTDLSTWTAISSSGHAVANYGEQINGFLAIGLEV